MQVPSPRPASQITESPPIKASKSLTKSTVPSTPLTPSPRKQSGSLIKPQASLNAGINPNSTKAATLKERIEESTVPMPSSLTLGHLSLPPVATSDNPVELYSPMHKRFDDTNISSISSAADDSLVHVVDTIDGSVLMPSKSSTGALVASAGASARTLTPAGTGIGSPAGQKASGKASRANAKHLYMVKGADHIRVVVVPIAASSINSGDCFVYDEGPRLIVWKGCQANIKEKAKVLALITRIKSDEKRTSAQVIMVDEPKTRSGSPTGNEAKFWAAIGCQPNEIAKTTNAPTDAAFEASCETAFQLLDLSGSEHRVIATGKALKAELLHTEHVYVVVASDFEVYVWSGLKAPQEEFSATAARCQSQFAATPWLVDEGAEPVVFREKFANWKRN